jgi:hypothetical protein
MFSVIKRFGFSSLALSPEIDWMRMRKNKDSIAVSPTLICRSPNAFGHHWYRFPSSIAGMPAFGGVLRFHELLKFAGNNDARPSALTLCFVRLKHRLSGSRASTLPFGRRSKKHTDIHLRRLRNESARRMADYPGRSSAARQTHAPEIACTLPMSSH